MAVRYLGLHPAFSSSSNRAQPTHSATSDREVMVSLLVVLPSTVAGRWSSKRKTVISPTHGASVEIRA
jgi:hypothetical protein